MAKLLAEEMTSSKQVIGIGTGVAINEYLREISERLTDGRLQASLVFHFPEVGGFFHSMK